MNRFDFVLKHFGRPDLKSFKYFVNLIEQDKDMSLNNRIKKVAEMHHVTPSNLRVMLDIYLKACVTPEALQDAISFDYKFNETLKLAEVVAVLELEFIRSESNGQ